MSAAKMALWREYHQRYGFPVDRVVWTIAKAGAEMCNAWGAKIKPQQLIPEFIVQRGMSSQALAAGLAAIPGAKVERVSASEMARRLKASRTI